MYQPFNLLFYRGNSPIGRLIKFISKGKYSHCAIMLDRFHTLELSWKNPSVIKHFNYKPKKYDIYYVNVHLYDYQKEIILQYLIDNIYSGYDFKFLLSRGFHILFGTPIKNSKKTKTCDELVMDAFRQVGIKLVDETEMLTPDSLSRSEYLRKISE